MDRRKELLNVNVQWAIDKLIGLLAYVHKIEDYQDLFFEDLETLSMIHLDEKEEKTR